MTPFWLGVAVGAVWMFVVLGAARLCGVNDLGADEETAADRERVS